MTPFDGSGLHIRTPFGVALEKPTLLPGALKVSPTANRQARSARIAQVKAMFAKGWRGREIAEALGLHENTVYTYKLKGTT